MERTQTLKVVFSLLMIFLLSVAVRYPNINRPLSKHHEYITAVSLRVLQIWGEEGAAKYNYNPVMNYNGSANKFINNHASTTGGMIDKEGNYYYVSHPQFAYILPHFFFSILQIKPSVLSLQIFHLVVNFFSASFIYLIICLLSIQRPFKKIFIPALIGFVIYLFNPAVLWFQCNTYMSDTLVQLPFILTVYTILKLLMRKRFYSIKYLLYYALFLFLMIYTSWLGLFFVFSVLIYSLIKLRYEKVFLPLIFVTISITVFALYFVIKQYSLINGIEAYFMQLLQIFSERGSFRENSIYGFFIEKLLEIKLIIINYTIIYLPIFLLLSTFILLTSSKKKLGFIFTKNAYRFLWLSTLPILILHLFLLNYSGYNFVQLYGSIFLSVVVGVLYSKLNLKKVLPKQVLNSGVVFVVILSIMIYYYINWPGEYSWKGDFYATNKNIGEFIQKDAKENEVVYIVGDLDLDPQLIVYAKRNINLIKQNDIKSLDKDYVVYSLKNGKIVNIQRN